MSYGADKLGDGRTDGRRQRQYPKAKIDLGLKNGLYSTVKISL